MEELLQSIKYSKVWVDMFNRVSYEDGFKQYKTKFGPLFENALANYCCVNTFASEFVDAIEASWGKERAWNRKAVKIDQKMVMTVFLSPMLLSLENEKCHELAYAICDAWNKKFPKDIYTVANHDEIVSGFTNSIFGLKR